MANNCKTCHYAKDQGKDFACRFNIDKVFETMPYYPVFVIKATRNSIIKDKVPNKDCPAWREKKGTDKK